MQVGNPVLREVAGEVDERWLKTKEADRLIEEMVATMRAAPGVGLAAPQIGLSLQLVVLEDRDSTISDLDEDFLAEVGRRTVPLTVLMNPTIEVFGKPDVELFEGCLSVHGFSGVTPRHHRARVHALNHLGEEITLDWTGWPARILQHECDHLLGNLYIDRMDTRTFSTNENLMATLEDE